MNESSNHTTATHYPGLQTKTRHTLTNYNSSWYLNGLFTIKSVKYDEVYTHSAVSAAEELAQNFLLPWLRGYSDARRHAPLLT